MKIVRPFVVVVLLLLWTQTSFAIIFVNSGRGLRYTKAAWVQEKGRLTLLGNTRFWGKVKQYDQLAGGAKSAVTVWDVQGLVGLNYGLGDHFGVAISPVSYQDVHQGSDGMDYPWDTYAGLKIGSFGSKASSLSYGVELGARFPTGEFHNVQYEHYTAGTVEFGFTGLLSYATDPLYPEDALNIHANLGYWHHNDVGEDLVPGRTVEEENVLHPSQELLYGLGFVIPTQSFDYGFEFYGNVWLQQPPITAAGREYYNYLNTSVTYKPYRWFDFIVAGEYRLNADKDETVGPFRVGSSLPNYNTWRIHVGAKFTLLPTSVFRTTERDVLMQKAENRRELFEQIIRERRETESAEEELERIREERRKAERELERLRKILEGQRSESGLEDMQQGLEPN